MAQNIQPLLQKLDTVLFLLAGQKELPRFGERADYKALDLPECYIDLLAELHRRRVKWHFHYIDELMQRNEQLARCDTELREYSPKAEVPPLRGDICIVGSIPDDQDSGLSLLICCLTSRLTGSTEDQAYFLASMSEESAMATITHFVELRTMTDQDFKAEKVEMMSLSGLLDKLVSETKEAD